MMKTMTHTYKAWIVTMLMAMVLFPSCERESFEVTFQANESNTLTLKLLCSENVESRTADNINNEDAIHRLDIFLYPNTANFDTPATFSKTINNLISNESHSVNLTLDNTTITNLFGTTGTSCKVYVIANRPDATALTNGETSVNQLKALTITATFNSFPTDENVTSVYQPQADFVMDSDFIIDGDNDKITLNRDNHTLSGTVPLFRAASKISLIIDEVKSVPLTDADGNVQKDEQGNDIIWTANTSGMLVRLHDGVSKSHIDNSVQPYDVQEKTETQEGDYFNFAKGQEVKMTPVESDWKNIPAFYSYSSDWSAGADEEPYLTLIVPWKRSDVTTEYYQPTYYQVPISTIAQKLERNTHYKITLTVSRLGSFVEEVPETIAPSSYIIVPWQSETVDADLMDYRYLMVEEKEITIYNEDGLYIPYVTSHTATIVESTIKFYQQDITGADPEWDDIKSTNSNYFANLELVERNGVKQIYYKNVLDNVYTSPTFDFTPYKVTFTIQHTDNSAYKEEVTIIQYPAIYGEAEQNWDYSNNYNASTGNITENVTSNRNGNNGFAFVNGYQGSSAYSGTDFFLTANGVGSISGTYSPNRYIFTITSVEGTEYVVGDPRETKVTYDAESARWANAPSMTSSTKRELQNYYGTENSERTRNMIAPKFRLASAYGALNTGSEGAKSLEILRKRCASYQEDGYPAGRWRLPTEAEFKFIMTQVNRTPATLPPMYLKGYDYWCAHGLGVVDDNGSVTVNPITTSSSGHSTRCVYDEWYWTDKLETPAEKNVFTWGDQPR